MAGLVSWLRGEYLRTSELNMPPTRPRDAVRVFPTHEEFHQRGVNAAVQQESVAYRDRQVRHGLHSNHSYEEFDVSQLPMYENTPHPLQQRDDEYLSITSA